MDFFDSVKQELLRKKEASISKIDDRINQLQEQLQEKANSVSAVSNETDGIKSRKSEMESNTMSEKELDDLQVLYNFLSNYPKIVRITNLLRGMGSGSSSYVVYIYDDATEQNSFGYAAVKKDGKWGCIDQDGAVVVKPSLELSQNVVVSFIGTWHLAPDINANYYTNNDE